ncbi:murein hydrolase activator EnvC family protein [Capillimicrobium parvum]|uniref:M23ase beta-sheet core domain-containing protein n=1 Tax=Capillimicrobium parvum TaxID=2884022 RepID=A0A9E6XUJ0_9ACTN|nr:M23 family metallopeptidase [Capillimicrobium parvum]UGS34639.1 hypothetical protein DSM104329_01018 [Capillimicrobium parvum]
MPSRPPLLTAVALALAALLALPARALASWRLPVDGGVVARFSVGPDPFAAGQRRGVDLAAPAGSIVVAPCAGRVSFAGRLPHGRAGVSIRCGALTATVLGLARPSVRAGDRVRPGRAVGAVGADGLVRLGARRTVRRWGYVDPLSLVEGVPPPRHAPPAGPAARRVRPAPPALRRSPSPSASPVAVAAERTRAPAQRRVPLAAWAGVALLALAVPGGAVAGRARRRRHARIAATAAG